LFLRNTAPQNGISISLPIFAQLTRVPKLLTCHISQLRMDSSDVDSNLIHGSLDQHESAHTTPHTTSRSVQLYLQGSSFYLNLQNPMLDNALQWVIQPQNCPFRRESQPPSNTWFLRPTWVTHPHDISIGSAIFVGLKNLTNRRTNTQTDRQTDRQCYSVCSNSPNLMHWLHTMWPKNSEKHWCVKSCMCIFAPLDRCPPSLGMLKILAKSDEPNSRNVRPKLVLQPSTIVFPPTLRARVRPRSDCYRSDCPRSTTTMQSVLKRNPRSDLEKFAG